MKNSIIKGIIALFLFLAINHRTNAQPGTPPPPGEVTLQTFYDQLAPYGQWVNYPNLGYVFVPSVAPGFEPYSTAGHWVYNEQYGWTWASDYPWGWAAFHYGRWNFDNQYGWMWVPDLNWGPAWVAWRSSEGYYGWAPLPWGVDINIGFAGGYGIRPEHWCFIPREHMCEFNLGMFFIPRVHNMAFIDHSFIINRMDYDNGRHFGYFKGPDRFEVERFTHAPVRVYREEEIRVHPDFHRGNEYHAVPEHRVDAHPVEAVRHDQPARRDFAPARHVEIQQVPRRGNYGR